VARYRGTQPDAEGAVGGLSSVGNDWRDCESAGLRAFGSAARAQSFQVPAAGTHGNLGRNSLRGFGATQTDLSLRRQFKLRESVSLQARAEVFNLLNHPNFGSPAAALNNANFSISTQMLGRSLGSAEISAGFSPLYQVGGPRSLQFAQWLQF